MIFVRQQQPTASCNGRFTPYAHPQLFFVTPKETKATDETASKDKPAAALQETKSRVLPQKPNVYVTDNKDDYRLSFDLPGVKSQDLTIEVDNGVLHVTAERKAAGVTVAKFAEHFAIDETLVDVTKMEADLSDGVLTLTVPKKEEGKPFTIPITAAEPPADSEDLSLSLDIPGVKVADLKVVFHKGELLIAAERKKKGDAVSKIRRMFTLKESAIEALKMKAYLIDGVLTITVPKKAAKPAKKIAIGAEPTKPTIEEQKDREIVIVETAEDDEEEQKVSVSSEDSKNKEWHHVIEENDTEA